MIFLLASVAARSARMPLPSGYTQLIPTGYEVIANLTPPSTMRALT